MQNQYEISMNTLSLSEFTALCSSVGWTDAMNFEAAKESLKNTLLSVTIRENGHAIGMGRIIGDGAIYFYIQDVVVHPDYQGKRIGKKILTTLINYLEENAPNKAFVGLFASEGNQSFYEKFDFKDYAPNMTGMFKVIRK